MAADEKSIVEIWRDMAQAATEPKHLIMVPREDAVGYVCSVTSRNGQVLARDMRHEDARFLSQARSAVLFLTAEVALLQAYAAYVTGIVEETEPCKSLLQEMLLPMTFEEWIVLREQAED